MLLQEYEAGDDDKDLFPNLSELFWGVRWRAVARGCGGWMQDKLRGRFNGYLAGGLMPRGCWVLERVWEGKRNVGRRSE